jgi:hypothetical protein
MSQILDGNKWSNVTYHVCNVEPHSRTQDQVRKTFGRQPIMPGAPDSMRTAPADLETVRTQ